jgi:hypothetical protein
MMVLVCGEVERLLNASICLNFNICGVRLFSNISFALAFASASILIAFALPSDSNSKTRFCPSAAII